MKIDVFSHIVPPKFKELLEDRSHTHLPHLGHVVRVPAIFDLDARFRVMDEFPDVLHLLTYGSRIPSDMAGPDEALDLCMRLNEEMAELVSKHPDRFAGAVAVVPLNDIDAALKELDRGVNDLHLKGVLVSAPINGKPPDLQEFMPLYEAMVKCDLPIWIHPQRGGHIPDYAAEEGGSKYLLWSLWGFLYETTAAMTRLAVGGVLQKYPTLKFITHHCGAMVPFFSARIGHHYDLSAKLMGPDWDFKRGLSQEPIEYFRKFYNDTVTHGNASALMCAYEFFGAAHLLFGTDFPFDAEMGAVETRGIIKAIESLKIPEAEKKKIFEGNAREICRLPT